jgi:3-oxoacyl-[acyl-carrier-protein] synthase II
MEHIVITGMGVVSPLGNTPEELWQNVSSGRSGIAKIDFLEGLPATFGGLALCFNPSKYLGNKDSGRLDRHAQMGVTAGLDAVNQAGITKETYPEFRTGVLVGTGAGGVATFEEQNAVFRERGPKRMSPLSVPMYIANMTTGYLSILIGAKGPGMAVASACATGGHALGLAARLIQTGDADCMIAGGVEACVTRFIISGFAAMRALSTRNDDPSGASRPFDNDRDGFVMSEGGAVFVLEKESAARKRGATILAWLLGIGMTQDAYHIVAPDPDAPAIIYAMQQAIHEAGLNPEQIGYVNAHGTSTTLNDKAETVAIKKAFGRHAYNLKISSTKSMTGHLIGGAAALETAISIMALNNSILPPTINLNNPDPECDLDYIPNVAVSTDTKYCMNNAFGFGGQNVCLVIGKGE